VSPTVGLLPTSVSLFMLLTASSCLVIPGAALALLPIQSPPPGVV
jgi:hypothetical protein